MERNLPSSNYLFTTQTQLLTNLKKKPFENIVGKGENASHQHFLLFPQCFLPFSKEISIFQSHLSSANASNLDQSEILSFGKELNQPTLPHYEGALQWYFSIWSPLMETRSKNGIEATLHNEGTVTPVTYPVFYPTLLILPSS